MCTPPLGVVAIHEVRSISKPKEYRQPKTCFSYVAPRPLVEGELVFDSSAGKAKRLVVGRRFLEPTVLRFVVWLTAATANVSTMTS